MLKTIFKHIYENPRFGPKRYAKYNKLHIV